MLESNTDSSTFQNSSLPTEPQPKCLSIVPKTRQAQTCTDTHFLLTASVKCIEAPPPTFKWYSIQNIKIYLPCRLERCLILQNKAKNTAFVCCSGWEWVTEEGSASHRCVTPHSQLLLINSTDSASTACYKKQVDLIALSSALVDMKCSDLITIIYKTLYFPEMRAPPYQRLRLLA